MSNITVKLTKSKYYIVPDCEPILEIVNDPVNELLKLPPDYLKILNLVRWLERCFTIVFISEKQIAKRIGCSLRTVQRAVALLRRLGLLSTARRFNESLIYKTSSFFDNQWIQHKLKKLLPALIWTSISLLINPIVASSRTHFQVAAYKTKELYTFMGMPIFNRLSTTLCMTTEQNKLLLSYPAHIVNYAEQVMLNNTRLMKWGTKDKQARYLLTTCSNQASKKYRSYDPISVATKTTVAVKQNPSKATTGPVVDSEIPTSTFTPPPVFKPEHKDSAKDIINYVSDNFGLESLEVTENGRTTKMALSDKGIVPLASIAKKPKPATERRKVQWIDSVTAQVAGKEEDGLQAFAQLMMATVPIIKETVKEEILRDMHKPKHATVDDLIADSMQQHIQVDGATETVIGDDDGWWAKQSAPLDMDEWLF